MPPSPADRPPHRPRRTSPSVSIVIPVRDAAGLAPMLRTLPAADEVIVVTAGPGPDAAVLAACPGALLVRQTRTGLGNALACGFATATGDVLVTLDGDGATDPAELPRYVDALLAGADVAFGSRYRDGGRDLTAGRFRRALNLVLAWLLNVLYGAHRTDPGFGYAAFRRGALDRLTLPDPAPASPALWGDGPEIEALLAVRAAARGLTVAEVPSVAYPRMRRSSHADRATVRHWLRVLLTEFRGRTVHPPRHSAAATTPAGLSTGAPHDLHFSARIEIGGGPRRVLKDQAAKDQAEADRLAAGQLAADRAAADLAAADRGAADQAPARDHLNPVEPIWGPARRTPDLVHLGLADIPAPLDRPVPPAPGKSFPPGGFGGHEPAVASVPAPRT
jgi:Glycosyl transferase family 2